MSDELKAAIERQKYGLYSLSEEAKWAPQEHERELRDLKLIARAYLARLAADEQQAREDAEPITGHVIASLEPKEQFGEALFVNASFVMSTGSRLSIGGFIGDDRGFKVAIHGTPAITTRGQLRKLLEALKGGVS